MSGTPCDVPVPRNSTRAGALAVLTLRLRSPLDVLGVTLSLSNGTGRGRRSRDDDARRLGGRALGRLDVPQAQLVDDLLEQLALLRGQIAFSLLFEQREDVDELTCGGDIGFAVLPGRGIGDVAEVKRRRVSKREHEADKRHAARLVFVARVVFV